ncbi:bifunctional helix-turn-helix transcriptional regulator/GNAT family N-acetyltransferase [Priestia megaterium]|uniref:bifunctional helix-turn-helix transcriptional regulator/GNAT family N-acetyltransferase n=1 Tax=Priestia megaterium TaxID=1404 RepID=UPI000CA1020D|nr:helix-turn-helix domain-containing GNAT family N-acetyltransferase [Priestia megaterium]AUO09720.1 MarR family transcriptional regulator [Priestia megaterium]PVE64676.1 MarR family transcriptional regulator [Priestia megaterium]PVE80223.1 MarR family transcriptional regulator [Priestia megaterium]PVE88484.1 MarR family transcriptional regulator [Priestia megaterium]PVE93181.1 MarR family transcriptional regulator [Priestia megaterium]
MVESHSESVSEFRQFNRFYTHVLGLLNQQIYDSPFSLTETRILFEINSKNNCTAKLLQEELALDRGYVSRILKRFDEQNMIYKEKSEEDGRTYFIHLTEKAKKIYYDLEGKANEQVKFFLRNLDSHKQQTLIKSMNTIEEILLQQINPKEFDIYIKGDFTPEDKKDLIIEKQRAFYTDNYGFDATFLDYLHETFDAEIEKVWIAENHGDFVGSIGIVKENEKTAMLRWFIVEDNVRGKGVGTRLIQLLLDYCKEQQYERVILWTISSLPTARRLYKKFGFEITETKEEQLLWGQKLIEERWELELRPSNTL